MLWAHAVCHGTHTLMQQDKRLLDHRDAGMQGFLICQTGRSDANNVLKMIPRYATVCISAQVQGVCSPVPVPYVAPDLKHA